MYVEFLQCRLRRAGQTEEKKAADTLNYEFLRNTEEPLEGHTFDLHDVIVLSVAGALRGNETAYLHMHSSRDPITTQPVCL